MVRAIRSVLVDSRHLDGSEGIGYAAPTRVGTIPIGHFDGFPAWASFGKVLIRGQLRTEQTDQEVEHGLALPAEQSHRAGVDWQIVCHRKHVDEALPEHSIRHPALAAPLDLWENLQLAAGDGNDADDAACAEPLPPVLQHTFTIGELAEREGIAVSYLTRVLRLTLLAPDIVEAILDGTQEPDRTLSQLLETLPTDWQAQRRGHYRPGSATDLARS